MTNQDRNRRNAIKSHFDSPENCYDAERSWIALGNGKGIEVVMIEYRQGESIISWRNIGDDFGDWRFGTIRDLNHE